MSKSKKNKVNWLMVDPYLECELQSMGIEYQEASLIPRSNLVLSTQPRIDGRHVDREQVEQLKDAIKRGKALYPLVVHKHKTKKELDHGLHRLTAIDELIAEGWLEDTRICCILILSKSELHLDTVRVIPNLPTSVELSLEQKKMVACEMQRKSGKPMSKIAEIVGISVSTLNKYKEIEDLRRLCIEEGILEVQGLNDTVLLKLCPLQKDIVVLREAVMVTLRNGLTSLQVVDMVQDVRMKRSEAGRIAVIREYEANRPESPPSIGPPTIRSKDKAPPSTVAQRIYAVVKNLSSLLDRNPTIGRWGLSSEDEKKKFQKYVAGVMKKMQAALREGGK